jgi:hypothetical protein
MNFIRLKNNLFYLQFKKISCGLDTLRDIKISDYVDFDNFNNPDLNL